MKNLTLPFICLLLAVPCQARTIYVDVDATGANNGSTWTDAYNYLADAFADANSTGDVDEIRVAQGIYTPDSNSADPNGSGDREATFHLINGVTIKGGYAGFGQPDPNVRDIEIYETILSGDLLDNDGPDFANNGENSYHVVTGSDTNETAIFDGFTITAGNADGSYPYSSGGGMLNDQGSPTVTDCIFSRNWAEYGGGMRNYQASPTLINCTFSDNSAKWHGGGMHNYFASPTVTHCTFSTNSANDGGGMYNTYDIPRLNNYTFSTNSAENSTDNPMLNNCIFSGNSAGFRGGGIYNIACSPTVTNCILSGNSAGYHGGGMYSGGEITNCIIWGNWPDQIYSYEPIIIIYSNVQGGWPGTGNIDADPCFADPCNGDYHLKSEGWRWDSIRQRWDWDDVTSRCIDAGNPGSPLGDELLSIPVDPNNIWGQNLRINMGAFGGTAEASMPPYDWAILGDLTNDGLVNLTDFAYQSADWLNSADRQPGDLNRDSLIDISDLALFVEDWLEQTTWHE